MTDEQRRGRQSRNARREQARALAKELLRPDAPEKVKREKKAKFFTFISLGAAFGSWGYSALAPDPGMLFGSALLGLCLLFGAAALWESFDWKLKIKIPVFALLVIGFGVGGYLWVRFVTRPSFVFIVPGVVLNENAWDFIVNHRGPKGSQSVEILFTDLDRQKSILEKKPAYLSPEMLNSYQSVLKYPEINPGGRGSLFGLQFAWQPLVLEHEHFAADITAKDRTLHQELQIEKVAGKWLWATQIKDRDTGKQILNCKDDGFPYGPTASTRCFPEMLSTDN